jgi:hypothetical protein
MGTVRDQVFGDLAIAHVRGGAKCGLPIAESPIPGGFCKSGTGRHQFLHAFEIEVSNGDHFADQLGWLCRKSVRDRDFERRCRDVS